SAARRARSFNASAAPSACAGDSGKPAAVGSNAVSPVARRQRRTSTTARPRWAASSMVVTRSSSSVEIDTVRDGRGTELNGGVIAASAIREGSLEATHGLGHFIQEVRRHGQALLRRYQLDV